MRARQHRPPTCLLLCRNGTGLIKEFRTENLTWSVTLPLAELKLQHQKIGEYRRKHGGISKYFRFVIQVPEDLIVSMGWKEATTLDFAQAGEALVVYPRPARTKKVSPSAQLDNDHKKARRR